MNWVIQVRIEKPKGEWNWISVCPSGSLNPYVYGTKEDAEKMMNICYPDSFGENVRIKEVDDES